MLIKIFQHKYVTPSTSPKKDRDLKSNSIHPFRYKKGKQWEPNSNEVSLKGQYQKKKRRKYLLQEQTP